MKKVILISGKQGSGKTTLAKRLRSRLLDSGHGVVKMKFAEPLYHLHAEILLAMHSFGECLEIKLDKTLLQLLGTEWGRKRLGEDVWVRIAKRRVESVVGSGFVIIDDCRFPNELAAFPDALSIRLECSAAVRKERCESWRDNENHESEVALDAHLDKFTKVINTEHLDIGTVTELVMELVR